MAMYNRAAVSRARQRVTAAALTAGLAEQERGQPLSGGMARSHMLLWARLRHERRLSKLSVIIPRYLRFGEEGDGCAGIQTDIVSAETRKLMHGQYEEIAELLQALSFHSDARVSYHAADIEPCRYGTPSF